MKKKKKDIVVYITTSKESRCDDCGEVLEKGSWITMTPEKKALCLSCADLEHLVYLHRGNVVLTRRSRKHSILDAVVVKWSKTRRQYERQGVLVEEEALHRAEKECLEDEEARTRKRERAAIRRREEDRSYIALFTQQVREIFPSAPEGVEKTIANHACLKYSGRVGRSASAKRLDEEAVRLAVVAHVRHRSTNYDDLLAQGYGHEFARLEVRDRVDDILDSWERQPENPHDE
ncbi:MAG TPA: DUF2293 domain-containing protein [Thermoanaerobaculia bacterium]|nr:DUF2293 domain-containing protein [Thermoanaerobaculia bacterium]HUM29189.1 DUF2293 domain-containing protein [Thermoanaerobaculia bacterium]HXK67568.1 DUF2293 domain-containing protein [Thermoanaerobaculia bacterium]